MTGHNAFERQIAREIEREVGPPRSVDALAIARAAKQPRQRWRYGSMFNVTRLAAAGVVLAAVGAFAVTGRLTGPGTGGPADTLASPSIPPEEAAWVHGTLTVVDCCGTEVETHDASGHRLTLRDETRTGTAEMDDPRLSGQYTMVASEDNFPQPDGAASVDINWGEFRIENAEGVWQGDWSGTWNYGAPTNDFLVLYRLTGAGAYEGLSALLSITEPGYPTSTVAGAIFPGALPPR